MSCPIKMLDLELTEPLADVEGLEAYSRVRFLMRYRGTPVRCLERTVIEGAIRAGDLSGKHLERSRHAIILEYPETNLASQAFGTDREILPG